MITFWSLICKIVLCCQSIKNLKYSINLVYHAIIKQHTKMQEAPLKNMTLQFLNKIRHQMNPFTSYFNAVYFQRYLQSFRYIRSLWKGLPKYKFSIEFKEGEKNKNLRAITEQNYLSRFYLEILWLCKSLKFHSERDECLKSNSIWVVFSTCHPSETSSSVNHSLLLFCPCWDPTGTSWVCYTLKYGALMTFKKVPTHVRRWLLALFAIKRRVLIGSRGGPQYGKEYFKSLLTDCYLVGRSKVVSLPFRKRLHSRTRERRHVSNGVLLQCELDVWPCKAWLTIVFSSPPVDNWFVK